MDFTGAPAIANTVIAEGGAMDEATQQDRRLVTVRQMSPGIVPRWKLVLRAIWRSLNPYGTAWRHPPRGA